MQSKLPPANAKGAGSKFAYGQLKQAIIEGQIPPNAPVVERELIEQFSISRTPLREAITRLSSENLVILRPNKSTIVADPTPSGLPAFIEAFKSISQAICFSAARAQTRNKQSQNLIQQSKLCENRSAEFPDILLLLEAISEASRNRYLALEFIRLHENCIRLSYLHAETDTYRELVRSWGVDVSTLIVDGREIEARNSVKPMTDRVQALFE